MVICWFCALGGQLFEAVESPFAGALVAEGLPPLAGALVGAVLLPPLAPHAASKPANIANTTIQHHVRTLAVIFEPP